jgi:rod shape-determining protein MreD
MGATALTQLRGTVVLITLLVVQTTLIADLPLLGVRGDLVLLAAIAAGIAGGPERGALVGFVAGLGYDLLVVQTPVGLYALAYCLTGYAVGMVQGSVLRASWWIPMVSAFVASVAGITVFAVLGKLVGHDEFIDTRLLKVAVIVGIVNALLVLPALRLVRWVLPDERRAPRLAV